MIRRFARPYARAIMEFAQTPDKATALRDELARFEEVRRSSREMQDLYANPGIDAAAKNNVTSAIGKRLGLSDLAMRVLGVLIQNHRINDLDAIIAALSAMIRQATGTVAAEVRSASQLSPSELAELTSMLEKKVGAKVEVDVKVDPSLIGGFVAKIGSEVYDASVAGKIEKFRESLA